MLPPCLEVVHGFRLSLFFDFCSFDTSCLSFFQPRTLNPEPVNLYMVNTHIIIRKYSVYPIEFVCFFAIDEYMRGLHGIDLSTSPFGWFVLSHPLYCRTKKACRKSWLAKSSQLSNELNDPNHLNFLDKQPHGPATHISTFRTQVIQEAYLDQFGSF